MRQKKTTQTLWQNERVQQVETPYNLPGMRTQHKARRENNDKKVTRIHQHDKAPPPLKRTSKVVLSTAGESAHKRRANGTEGEVSSRSSQRHHFRELLVYHVFEKVLHVYSCTQLEHRQPQPPGDHISPSIARARGYCRGFVCRSLPSIWR